MEPDLNALTVFSLVAEERSFRAAADRLGVTRSAVSQTIRRLEETLGIAAGPAHDAQRQPDRGRRTASG